MKFFHLAERLKYPTARVAQDQTTTRNKLKNRPESESESESWLETEKQTQK